jgi:hypothetical protein
MSTAELSRMAEGVEIRLFLASVDQPESRASLRKQVLAALKAEYASLLLRRRQAQRGVASSEDGARPVSLDAARIVVALVKAALPAGGPGELVLQVALEERQLYHPDRRRFALGIPALARAVREALAPVFGYEGTSEFIAAVRRIRDAIPGAQTADAAEDVLGRAQRLLKARGADDLRRRMSYLPYSAFTVVKMFEAGKSSAEVIEVLSRRRRGERADVEGPLTERDIHEGQVEFVLALGAIRRAFGS